MNLCILLGRIITEIDFKFIITGKNVSIAIFKLKVNKNCTIIVKAYNNLADYCYKNLKRNSIIMIYGRLNSKMETIVNDIKKIRIA